MKIKKMHHVAYRCRDGEETRRFYEDLLGLPLAHVIKANTVPSTGEYAPYVHLFFRLGDESCIAFFDLGDEKISVRDPDTPAWLPHFAMEVATMDELEFYRRRLADAGVEVIGPADHGFVKSIYFFDPNGVRLEITTPVVGDLVLEGFEAEARAALDAWTARDRAAPIDHGTAH